MWNYRNNKVNKGSQKNLWKARKEENEKHKNEGGHKKI